MVFCWGCGKEIHEKALSCPCCGAIQKQPKSYKLDYESLPSQAKGWSWGAFFLTWIWAIGNHVWIGLLALIPIVNIFMMFYLAACGRRLAWEAKSWRNAEEFIENQKNWSFWGVALATGMIVIGVFFGIKLQNTLMNLDVNKPQMLSSEGRSSEQALRLIKALPEYKEWSDALESKTQHTVKATITLDQNQPTKLDKTIYWSFTAYEEHQDHYVKWQTFLVNAENGQILVYDYLSDTFIPLKVWINNHHNL